MFFRLALSFFYYSFRPKKHLFSPTLFVLILFGIFFTTTYLFHFFTPPLQQALLFYSPFESPAFQRNLTASLYDQQMYEASYLTYHLLSNKQYPNKDFWPAKMERFLFPKDSLLVSQAKTQSLITNHPTSRDLWILNGWIALYLQDIDEVLKTKEVLLKIDPNNEFVRLFFNTLHPY